jgi:hypothetical protein
VSRQLEKLKSSKKDHRRDFELFGSVRDLASGRHGIILYFAWPERLIAAIKIAGQN